jgi:hypothetical protein
MLTTPFPLSDKLITASPPTSLTSTKNSLRHHPGLQETTFKTGFLICGVTQNVNKLIVGPMDQRDVNSWHVYVVHLVELSLLNNGHKTVPSMIQIIVQVTRLEDRPRLFGIFGAVFGLCLSLVAHLRIMLVHFIIIPSSVCD